MPRRIVILGNGIAGITAARQLRKRGDDAITVVSGESDHFFSRTALMYIYMGHMRYQDTKPYEDGFWKKNRIELVRERLPYSLEGVAIPARRGPATEARSCYVEADDVVRERETKLATLRQDRMLMPKTPGRPDKHTRRKLRERSRRRKAFVDQPCSTKVSGSWCRSPRIRSPAKGLG